jgi:hypothetical protein
MDQDAWVCRAGGAVFGSSMSHENNAKLEALKQFSDKIEAAGKKMEVAQASGDSKTQVAAAAESWAR